MSATALHNHSLWLNYDAIIHCQTSTKFGIHDIIFVYTVLPALVGASFLIFSGPNHRMSFLGHLCNPAFCVSFPKCTHAPLHPWTACSTFQRTCLKLPVWTLRCRAPSQPVHAKINCPTLQLSRANFWF